MTHIEPVRYPVEQATREQLILLRQIKNTLTFIAIVIGIFGGLAALSVLVTILAAA